MTFFKYIQYIQKYLHSIRFATDNGKRLLVIDMKFPAKWEVYKHLGPEELVNVLEQNYKDTSIKFLSFFAIYNEDEVSDLYDRIIRIIDKCIEEEKKAELLTQKIEELKNKFNELTLEDLESLVFKTKEDEKNTELTST
jgi:hypothetical protein